MKENGDHRLKVPAAPCRRLHHPGGALSKVLERAPSAALRPMSGRDLPASRVEPRMLRPPLHPKGAEAFFVPQGEAKRKNHHFFRREQL